MCRICIYMVGFKGRVGLLQKLLRRESYIMQSLKHLNSFWTQFTFPGRPPYIICTLVLKVTFIKLIFILMRTLLLKLPHSHGQILEYINDSFHEDLCLNLWVDIELLHRSLLTRCVLSKCLSTIEGNICQMSSSVEAITVFNRRG